jgi:hypothetical protein
MGKEIKTHKDFMKEIEKAGSLREQTKKHFVEQKQDEVKKDE